MKSGAEALLVAWGTGVLTSSDGPDTLAFDFSAVAGVCGACFVLLVAFVFPLRRAGFADPSRDTSIRESCFDCPAARCWFCLSLSLGQLGLARSRVLDHIGKFVSRSARHVCQFLYSKLAEDVTTKRVRKMTRQSRSCCRSRRDARFAKVSSARYFSTHPNGLQEEVRAAMMFQLSLVFWWAV